MDNNIARIELEKHKQEELTEKGELLGVTDKVLCLFEEELSRGICGFDNIYRAIRQRSLIPFTQEEVRATLAKKGYVVFKA